jgi:hypothetical protein
LAQTLALQMNFLEQKSIQTKIRDY